MALPSLLALAFGLLVALFNPQPAGPGSVAAQPNPAEILGALLWFGAAMIGMLIVYCITYAVALGATTVAVSQLYMGRPTSIREAYAPLRGRVGRLALLLVLVSIRLFGVLLLMFVLMGMGGALGAGGFPVLAGLMVLAGGLLALLLWLWVALRYAVSIPAAVLEDQTATDAIVRSINLTRGSLLRVFVLLVFTMVITYAVLAVFQGPFIFVAAMAGPESSTFFWMNLLGTIAGSVGGAFTAPLMIVAFAVLYLRSPRPKRRTRPSIDAGWPRAGGRQLYARIACAAARRGPVESRSLVLLPFSAPALWSLPGGRDPRGCGRVPAPGSAGC